MNNILKGSYFPLVSILLLFFSGANVYAEQISVVVNINNNEDITPEMVKQIYTDKRNFWESGKEILLFELPVKDKGRELFSKTLLNKSAISSQSDWSNRFVKNTIKNKVKIKPEKLVAKFVSINQSSIGYISTEIAKKQKNIKIIMTIDK